VRQRPAGEEREHEGLDPEPKPGLPVVVREQSGRVQLIPVAWPALAPLAASHLE